MGETEEKESEWEKESEGVKESEEGEEKSEERPVEELAPQVEEREEIDLNETARKQGLTTDDEFQSLMDGRSRMEVDTAEMAEGLDLASGAVGGRERSGELKESEGESPQLEGEGKKVEQTEEERPKSVTPQPEAREGEQAKQAEKEAEVQPEEPEQIAPQVSKPKATRRRLVLKSDPEEGRPKQRRVSQSCLGRWTSSKAGANTAADAVEISCEEERVTPTKLGEGSLSATSQQDASQTTEMASPTPDDKKEVATEMAVGLDLVSRVANMGLPKDDDTIVIVATKPTAQKETST